ncbi:uncharacterized protein LOC131181321 [Hevea brasiliensis]|uniref:uncharacterized protein LOC131181321 n=1 Tax=Hevea brasiliensis TaxID=3981 RepID=UPI0025FED415|nr:uncharacterized protein LOC131181321 [Hevea brasiliensis]
MVSCASGVSFRLTGFYGFPQRSRRRNFWDLLISLSPIWSGPWVCIRDFNDLLNPDDKLGGGDHPNYFFQGFHNAADCCNFSDILLHGYPFTWERGKGSSHWVQERLDRALANLNWLDYFHNCRLSNLSHSVSDHSPMFLYFEFRWFSFKRGRFKFEIAWLINNDLKEVVRKYWVSSSGSLLHCLHGCGTYLKDSSKSLHGNYRQLIARKKEQLDCIRRMNDANSGALFASIKNELNSLIAQEEAYWK